MVCLLLLLQGSQRLHGATLRVDASQTNNIPEDDAVAIAAGWLHNVALRANGTVVAWGDPSATANVPAGLTNVVAVAAGFGHCLALRSDGTVVAWGRNELGQTNVPTGLTNVHAVACGDYHNLVRVGDGPPVTTATIQNPVHTASGIQVSIPTQRGRVYRLEYTDSLPTPSWTPLPLTPGTGNSVFLTDPSANKPQRYYRVRRW